MARRSRLHASLTREADTHRLDPCASTLPPLHFQSPSPVAVFPQPLQSNLVQRRGRSEVDRRPAYRPTRERPRRRFHQEGAQVHVGDMSREVVQAVKDVGGICCGDRNKI